MSTLNVHVIVTRDSEIITATHVNEDTDFPDGNIAFAYQQALLDWVKHRPDPDDVGSWRPRVIEKLVPVDFATFQAAELGRIITPRDSGLGWPDDDPEAIAARAERRPYDVGSVEAA